MKSQTEAENLPFFRLSHNQELILFLIKKELQGTKFMQDLDRIGFDSSVFCPDLGVVIMSLVGFRERSDALWDWCHETMDSVAEKVNFSDSDSVHELALDFYMDLRNRLRSE